MNGFERVCFIKNTVKNPNIEIGDYTYYDDPEDSENFERNVLYHYDFVGDKLIIGKFCALATGVKFIMNGANHRMDTLTTFPFAIFGDGWAENLKGVALGEKSKGDTVIGHDVWIGYDATIMPGVTIGSGAIIASKSVVVSDVEPYSVYGGNPAKKIKLRFSEQVIRELLEICWWDWPYDILTEYVQDIFTNDIAKIRSAYEKVQSRC